MAKAEKPNYTVQQYKKFNGQTIMKALQLMNYSATTKKLAKHIAASIDQREEAVIDTVKMVLSNAVANGFLVHRGSSYRLPSTAYTTQTDRRKVRPKMSKSKGATKKVSKPRRRNVTGKVNSSKLKKKK